MKRLGILFCALVAGVTASPALAQTTAESAPQPPVFRSGASLVALNVTVQDNGSRYVSGLRPADFVVYEDGVKQEVQFFESTSVPVDLIVLLDTSASMTDKMNVVHDAAVGFLKTLRPGDRGAVVAFSDTVSVLAPLTTDHPALERAVLSTHPHGATSLNNAVYIALKEFGRAAKNDGEVRRQAIAVLSDGEDTSSLISFEDVLAVARRMGVNIYTVGLQSRYGAQRAADSTKKFFTESDYSMKELARETGAVSFFPNPADLRGVYATIAKELANQYSIGYVPVNARPDGRFRRVVVQVVSRPELRPRTRLGYTVGTTSASDDHPVPQQR